MAHTERYLPGTSGEKFDHTHRIYNKITVSQWYAYYCDEKL